MSTRLRSGASNWTGVLEELLHAKDGFPGSFGVKHLVSLLQQRRDWRLPRQMDPKKPFFVWISIIAYTGFHVHRRALADRTRVETSLERKLFARSSCSLELRSTSLPHRRMSSVFRVTPSRPSLSPLPISNRSVRSETRISVKYGFNVVLNSGRSLTFTAVFGWSLRVGEG